MLRKELTILFPVSTLGPTIPSKSGDTLREVVALLDDIGAKALAEPARRARIAEVFMLTGNRCDDLSKFTTVW